MKIVHKEYLDGYDKKLETLREEQFERYKSATDKQTQRSALRGVAQLTAKRSLEFVEALDYARGICNE